MAARFRGTQGQRRCSQSWPMTFTTRTKTCDRVYCFWCFHVVLYGWHVTVRGTGYTYTFAGWTGTLFITRDARGGKLYMMSTRHTGG